MKQHSFALTSGRRAFTLVELLVVIGIIAILASLLVAGVMAALRKGPETIARTDLSKIETAINKFKADHGFFPTSQLVLYENLASYNPGQPDPLGLNAASIAAISSRWPTIDQTAVHKWAGANATIPATGAYLEGDQCLVFWLDGIPNGANQPPHGFSNDSAHPTSATIDRVKTMDFDRGRITFRNNSQFPSYLDGFAANLPVANKRPYVYFSSNGRTNGYDTAGNTLGVSPYIQKAAAGKTPAQYWNASTFQIISAGADGTFGPGGLWPSNPLSGAVIDDMSNFNSSRLGAPD